MPTGTSLECRSALVGGWDDLWWMGGLSRLTYVNLFAKIFNNCPIWMKIGTFDVLVILIGNI